MSIFDKVKDFISPEEEEQELELSQEEMEKISRYEASGQENGISQDTNIALLEPRTFQEVEEIGRLLLLHKACIVNLHKMPVEFKQRVIDFLSGVVFGVRGTVKRIGNDNILFSPKNMQVGGNIDITNQD